MAGNRPLLNGIGVDVDAVGAKRDRGGQGAERLFFHLHLGPAGLTVASMELGAMRHSLPVDASAATVDVQVNALLGVRRVEHCDGEGLAVLAQGGAYVQRISRAAGVDRRLVAARGKGGLGLRRVAAHLHWELYRSGRGTS